MPDQHSQPVLTLEELEQLCRAANTGDTQVLARLRAALDARPDIWQRLGDLAQHLEMILVRLIAMAIGSWPSRSSVRWRIYGGT